MNTRYGVKIDPSRLHLVSREQLEAFFINSVRPVERNGDFALCRIRGEIFDVLCQNRGAPAREPSEHTCAGTPTNSCDACVRHSNLTGAGIPGYRWPDY